MDLGLTEAQYIQNSYRTYTIYMPNTCTLSVNNRLNHPKETMYACMNTQIPKCPVFVAVVNCINDPQCYASRAQEPDRSLSCYRGQSINAKLI